MTGEVIAALVIVGVVLGELVIARHYRRRP